MSATCSRFGAMARNLRSTRSGLPPAPFAGLVVAGVLPRLTPCMPSSRMMFITWSRPPRTDPTPRRAAGHGPSCIRTRPSGPCRVEPRREKSRRRRQNLVRPPQLRVLRPQTLELGHRLLRGLFRLFRGRRIRLVPPTPQRLGRDRPDPWPPRRSPSSPTNTRDGTPSTSLTAFALNSSVYLVPLDMIPSSPIELGEMRNKNQAISCCTARGCVPRSRDAPLFRMCRFWTR